MAIPISRLPPKAGGLSSAFRQAAGARRLTAGPGTIGLIRRIGRIGPVGRERSAEDGKFFSGAKPHGFFLPVFGPCVGAVRSAGSVR